MKRKREVYLISAILVLAAGVRLWGIGYGLPSTYCRPDEDRLIAVAFRISPADLNPGYFVWPGLPFYLSRILLEAAARLRPGLSGGSALELYLADPGFVHLLFRAVFLLGGLATVYLLYLVGRRLFSPGVGLLAAFFLALGFLHARDSRFAMLDIPAALLAVSFFLPAVGVLRRGRWGDYLSAGLLLGLAAAVKYYGILLAVPLLAAHFSRGRRESGRLLFALAVAGAVFFLGSPYTFLSAGEAFRDIRGEIITGQFVTGFRLLPDIASPRGWLYHPLFSLRWGMGLPLAAAALFGTGYCCFRAGRGGKEERLIVSFILVFYLALAFQRSCFIRYTMVLLPFLALAAALLLERLLPDRPGKGLVLTGAALLLMLEPSSRVVRLNNLLSSPDTRLTAGRWLEEHIPPSDLLVFPQPFLWTRPEGHQFYPNRVVLPPGSGPEELRDLLEHTFPGEKWVITGEHPLAYGYLDPGIRELLEGEGEPAAEFRGLKDEGPEPVFDPFDAFFVPLSGFSGVTAPGPDIRIYRFE